MFGVGPSLTKHNPFYSGQIGIAGSDSGLGIRLLPEARYIYLAPDSPNANDANDGTDPIYPKLTLDGTNGAFAACTAGHHDTVVYVAGDTALTLSGVLPWNKNFTHLIGVCAPTMVGQRARIFSPTTGAVSPMITVSATGCMFKDVYLNHQSSNATAAVLVRVTGARNVFDNVHFCGPTNAAAAIDASSSLQMGSGGSENQFLGCTIGSSTVVGGSKTGAMGLVFEANAAAKRNMWLNCFFSMNPAHTNAGFVELMNGGGIEDYQYFENCKFLNISTVMASAFVFHAPMDLVYKRFILKDCWGMGFTDWDALDSGYMYMSVYPAAGGGLQGFLMPTVVA